MIGRLVASLAFCLQRPIQVQANEKRTTPVSSYLDRRSLVKKGFIYFMDNSRGLDPQLFVLLLFSVLRVGRPPRH